MFLFGKGPNIHVIDIFRNYLSKLNFNCVSSTDFDVQKRITKNVNEQDICFIFTYSNLTKSMLEIYDDIKNRNTVLIIATSNVESPLFINSDYNFLIKNNEKILEDQTSSIISFLTIVMQILYLINYSK
ncbi:SIS domain-containing protein [Spiroplasma litorale]|nr:SIS domain-containing protein [Spiroplasma litorale]